VGRRLSTHSKNSRRKEYTVLKSVNASLQYFKEGMFPKKNLIVIPETPHT